MPIISWNVPSVSLTFLKRSLVFPILLLYSIFLHWSFRKIISLLCFGTLHSDGYIFPFLHCLLLHFFSQLFVRSTLTTILPCWTLFPPLGMVWVTTSCTMLWTFVHSSSGTLSDLNPWTYLPLLLYNHKGFMSYLDGLVVFPTLFNLSLNLAIRSSWSEPQSAPSLVFADCIELLHLWLQRI